MASRGRRIRQPERATRSAPIATTHGGEQRGAPGVAAGEARPLDGADRDKDKGDDGPAQGRQREQRRQHERDQDERGGDSRRQHRARCQDTAGRRSRRHTPCAAATCSLVRPKRRSRCEYHAIAVSSAAASKSGHSIGVK